MANAYLRKEILAAIIMLSVAISASGELLGKLVYNGDLQKEANEMRVLHQPASVQFSPSPGPIPSDEIASVMALSLGLSVPKDISWYGLQFGDLFNRPKGIMMLTVEGLPEGSKLKTSTMQSFPIKPVGELDARDIYTIAEKSSLPYHVNAIFNGQANTVSVAADEKIASAGYGDGKSSKMSFWNEEFGRWEEVHGSGGAENSVELEKSSLLKQLQLVLPKGFLYDAERNVVELNSKGLQVKYDMNNDVDFALFSEIININHQYELIKDGKKKIIDGVPDVYMFTISSLKKLEKQYGPDSKEFHGALYLIEKTVPKIVDSFRDLYDGNILIVGVTLQSDVKYIDEHKEEIHTILQELKNTKEYVVDTFHKFIPEIHVPAHIENAARQKLCNELKGSLARFSAGVLKFRCENQEEVHMRSRRALPGEKDKNKDGYTIDELNVDQYDSNFAAIFNIWLWLVIILALALYAVSLTLWNMDPGRDSIIYRLTQQKVKAD